MEKIEGLIIDDLGFVPAYKGDMIFHEGPLLSHLVNADNEEEHYFYKSTDKDDEHNRWLVFKITTKDLVSFFPFSFKNVCSTVIGTICLSNLPSA